MTVNKDFMKMSEFDSVSVSDLLEALHYFESVGNPVTDETIILLQVLTNKLADKVTSFLNGDNNWVCFRTFCYNL